jgi:geranylgeranyl diphosphate synthase type I
VTGEALSPSAAIDEAIDATLRETLTAVAPTGAVGAELVDAVVAAVQGGKRMRAAALMTSFAAHGGDDALTVAPVAAALELFQAAALVHDDVLDAATTRRGRPTAHITFADQHRSRADAGDAERFGLAGAVLTGDLSLMSALRAIGRAPLGANSAATTSLFTDMTELVTAGQYLDMRIASAPLESLESQVDDIRATMRSKTASYTAEFPLALGASAARGAGDHVRAAREAGLPAGIAFQLRDDLLGIIGEPAVTGKPVGDDIREGKRTVPLWHAWTHTDASGRAVLASAVGNAEASEELIRDAIAVIVDTGAIEVVELEIEDLGRLATSLVSDLDVSADGRTALTDLLSQWGVRTA